MVVRLPWPRPDRHESWVHQSLAPWRSFLAVPSQGGLALFCTWARDRALACDVPSLQEAVGDGIAALSLPGARGFGRHPLKSTALTVASTCLTIARLRAQAQLLKPAQWRKAFWKVVPPVARQGILQASAELLDLVLDLIARPRPEGAVVYGIMSQSGFYIKWFLSKTPTANHRRPLPFWKRRCGRKLG